MLDQIRRKFLRFEYEYSLHAVDQRILRSITRREVEGAIAAGEIIEDYPADKYGPSCLIFGRTSEGRPLHIQCTHPGAGRIKIITLYEPDPSKWIDYKSRRPM